MVGSAGSGRDVVLERFNGPGLERSCKTDEAGGETHRVGGRANHGQRDVRKCHHKDGEKDLKKVHLDQVLDGDGVLGYVQGVPFF